MKPLSGVVTSVEILNGISTLIIKTREGRILMTENRQELKIGDKVAVCYDYTKNSISRILPVESMKDRVFELKAPEPQKQIEIVHDDNFCTRGILLAGAIQEERREKKVRRGENRPFIQKEDRRSGALQPLGDGSGSSGTGSGNLVSGALCLEGEGTGRFWNPVSGVLELSACWVLDDGYDGFPLSILMSSTNTND